MAPPGECCDEAADRPRPNRPARKLPPPLLSLLLEDPAVACTDVGTGGLPASSIAVVNRSVAVVLSFSAW
jgi:hypothetical protein